MKYFNKQFHKGFTLAELMVCLALISIIATLMMPAISKLKPNKNKIMFKKAYSITERVVSELIDDNDLYPTGDEYQGFDNTTEVSIGGQYVDKAVADSTAAGSEAGTSTVPMLPYKGVTYSGNDKFCGLFGSKLDLGNSGTAAVQCSGLVGHHDSTRVLSLDGEPSFYTSDGIAWIMPSTDFRPTLSYKIIYVDVNGKQNGPNCYDSDYTSDEISEQSKMSKGMGPSSPERTTYSSNTEWCEQPDRFKIYVRADGKMKVEGAAAKAYLGTTNLTGNKEKGAKRGQVLVPDVKIDIILPPLN